MITALQLFKLGQASARPYRPEDNPYVQSFHPELIMGITHGSDYAYYALFPGWQLIAVNGSDDVPDWIRNCLWARINKRGAAHGFYGPAMGIAERIRPEIRLDLPLIVEGFSRGAAIASIIGSELGAYLAVLFNGPKPGGRKYARWAEDRTTTINFHVRGDIVPKLPLLRGKHPGVIRKMKLDSPAWNIVRKHKNINLSHDKHGKGLEHYQWRLT